MLASTSFPAAASQPAREQHEFSRVPLLEQGIAEAHAAGNSSAPSSAVMRPG
jgi:hypothetical protein